MYALLRDTLPAPELNVITCSYFHCLLYRAPCMMLAVTSAVQLCYAGLTLGAQANTNPDNLLVTAVLATPDRHDLKHSEHKHKLTVHQNTKTYELHLFRMYPNTNNCVLHILLVL